MAGLLLGSNINVTPPNPKNLIIRKKLNRNSSPNENRYE
jgi:hypothetical protein